MSAEWTDEDRRVANAEGWDVFDSYGSANGPWQIQRLDEEAILDNDTDAWELVKAKADAGSLVHCNALAFITEHNPQEAMAIRKWAEPKGTA